MTRVTTGICSISDERGVVVPNLTARSCACPAAGPAVVVCPVGDLDHAACTRAASACMAGRAPGVAQHARGQQLDDERHPCTPAREHAYDFKSHQTHACCG